MKKIKYLHNGKILTLSVIPYNDAFFEVVKGKYKGNLIHIFSIIK